MQIIDTGGNGQRTETVWMYLVQHGSGDESTAAVLVGSSWFPLVATTESALAKMVKTAQKVATESGKPLLLVRFDNRIDIGKVLP